MIVSPLLALMRNQIAAAAAGRHPRASRSTRPTPTSGTTCTRRSRADEVDVLLVSPERLNNPRLPRRAAARPGRRGRAARRRRGALHLRLGPRLPARLPPASATCSAELPAGIPVLATTATANDRVVADVAEQLGRRAGRDVRRPARRRSARDIAAARRAAAARRPAQRLAWLRRAPAPSCPARASSTRSPSPPPRTSPASCARPGHAVARLHRPDRHRPSASSPRGAARAQPRSRRWSPPARSAWASTSPTSASSCTSARRRRRSPTTSRSAAPAAPSSAPTCCCCPAPRTRRSGRYFAIASHSRPGAGRARCSRALGRADRPLSTPALEAARRPAPHAGSSCCSRCSTSTARSSGCRAAGSRPAQPWTYDAERYDRIAAARAAEQQAHARLRADHRVPDGVPARALDDDTAAPCGRCDNCAGAWYPTEVATDARGVGRAPRSTGPASELEPRAQWPHRRRPARRARARQDRRGRADARGPGPGPAHRPRLGQHAARAVRTPARRTRRPPPAVLAACVRVLAEWDWDERPAAVVSVPSRRHPLLVDVGRARARRGGPAALSRRARACADGGPTGDAGRQQRLPAGERLGPAFARRTRTSPTCSRRRTARCCSSTTWPTAGGRLTVAARLLRRAGAPPCSRSRSRCAGSRDRLVAPEPARRTRNLRG